MKESNVSITATKEEKLACISIKLDKKIKRSWENFKRCFKGTEYEFVIKNLDLRKASKTVTPLYLEANCCGSTLEVKRKKDFPLKNKKCKCKKIYLIKWE